MIKKRPSGRFFYVYRHRRGPAPCGIVNGWLWQAIEKFYSRFIPGLPIFEAEAV